MASFDHYLYALGLDGRLCWKTDLQEMAFGLAVKDGVAYIGNRGGLVFAIDAETGAVRWTFRTNGAIRSYPAVGSDLIFIGSDDHNLYALDFNGNLRWQFQTQGPISQIHAVAGDAVYVASLDHNVYALTSSGQLRWVFRGSQMPYTVGEPLVDGNAVLVGSRDGNLYCLDRENGALRWRFETQGIIANRPLLSDGVIYFGSNDTVFYAITADGKPLWKFKTQGWIDSWPVVSNGVVYFGSSDCHLYAVDAATGALRWKFATSIGTQSPVDLEPYLKQNTASMSVTWRSQELSPSEKRYREQGSPPVTGGSSYAAGSRYIEKSQYAAGSRNRYAK